MKRRDFIHKTAATASVFSIVPSHVLGFGKTAPNDKIQLGFIGVGKQGRGLMTNFVNYDNASVVARAMWISIKCLFLMKHFKKL